MTTGNWSNGPSTTISFSRNGIGRQTNDYPLLSDSDGTVAEAYDILLDEFADHRRLSQRSAFVIDPDQSVRYS
ncbi:MAG: redoxin domain-containing protein [Halobacteriota archaeon]